MRKIDIAERFIRILKNKIYKYFRAMLKTMDIHKLDELFEIYSSIYCR